MASWSAMPEPSGICMSRPGKDLHQSLAPGGCPEPCVHPPCHRPTGTSGSEPGIPTGHQPVYLARWLRALTSDWGRRPSSSSFQIPSTPPFRSGPRDPGSSIRTWCPSGTLAPVAAAAAGPAAISRRRCFFFFGVASPIALERRSGVRSRNLRGPSTCGRPSWWLYLVYAGHPLPQLRSSY